MKTKIEIKDIYGNALFTHEHEGNSAKETVGEAVRQNVRLRYANLGYADLGGADLGGAYLRGAYLGDADLGGAKNIPFIPLACPSDGAFIGWKKVNKCIVKLLIPEDAKRCSATTGKCRCDKAKVLEITSMKTNEHLVEIANGKYAHCVYKVGEMVYPDSFDDDRWNECSHGIHFFINRQEAVEYGL